MHDGEFCVGVTCALIARHANAIWFGCCQYFDFVGGIIKYEPRGPLIWVVGVARELKLIRSRMKFIRKKIFYPYTVIQPADLHPITGVKFRYKCRIARLPEAILHPFVKGFLHFRTSVPRQVKGQIGAYKQRKPNQYLFTFNIYIQMYLQILRNVSAVLYTCTTIAIVTQ